jgi:hypothetical protein
MSGFNFIDRYTGMVNIPKPWRACASCQATGVDIAASTEEADVSCPACKGTRRRPLYRSLLDIPWRIWRALVFGWTYAVVGRGSWGRRNALRAMLADFW